MKYVIYNDEVDLPNVNVIWGREIGARRQRNGERKDFSLGFYCGAENRGVREIFGRI